MRLSGVTNEAADKQLRLTLWLSFPALLRYKGRRLPASTNVRNKRGEREHMGALSCVSQMAEITAAQTLAAPAT